MPYPPDPQATDATNDLLLEDEHPTRHNAVAAAVNDVVAELGTNPSGAAADVAARLAVLDGVVDAKETPAGAQAKVDVEAAARAAADTGLDGRLDSVEATLPNKADLVGGLIPTAQIPAVALSTYLGAVATQAAMLALVGQPGDWATRTDIPALAILSGDDPTLLANWQLYEFGGAGGITSVDGDAGPVVVLAGDGPAGTATKRTLGVGATQAAAGNDARLSDARTPTAHKATHEPGGTDALDVDAAAAVGSLRTLGTGATQAAAGGHSHGAPVLTDHLDDEHLRIRDEFDRADRVGSVGLTTTHERAWGGEVAWSITGQRLHRAGAGYELLTLDPHHPFGHWSVTLGPGCDLAEWWLLFRVVDGDDYFRVGRGAANVYDVQRIVAGGIGAADVMLIRNEPHKVPEAGDVVTVVNLPDDGIDVYVNGVLYWTGAELDDHTERTVGLASASATPTFERVEFLPIAGGDATMLALAAHAATPHGGGGVDDGDKGDVTVSGGGATWTVDNDAITLAKLADVATARILGRTTAGTGDPEALTAAQAKALLAIVAADVSDFDTQVATTAILKSLADAAGDLLVGTADNTLGRLAKGAPLNVLRVNAGATALEWAHQSEGINAPKSAADTPDDEFSLDTLNAKWTAVSGAAGTVNLLEPGAAAVAKYDLATRPGRLLLQAAKGGFVRLRQDWALADGESVLCRIVPAIAADSSATLEETFFRFVLNNSDTTERTGAYLEIEWTPSTSAGVGYIYAYNGTTQRDLGAAAHTILPGQPFYFRWLRAGTNYHAMWSSTGEAWAVAPALTSAGVPDNIWLVMGSLSTSGVPAPVIDVSWVRKGGGGVDPWVLTW